MSSSRLEGSSHLALAKTLSSSNVIHDFDLLSLLCIMFVSAKRPESLQLFK